MLELINRVITEFGVFTQWLTGIVGGNEFLVATIFMTFSGTLYALRKVPLNLLRFALKRFYTTYTISNLDMFYSGAKQEELNVVIQWHKDNFCWGLVRNKIMSSNDDEIASSGTYPLIDNGLYFIKYVVKNRDNPGDGLPVEVTVQIVRIGFDNTTLKDKISRLILNNRQSKLVLTSFKAQYQTTSVIRHNVKSDVNLYLPETQAISLRDVVKNFINNKNWYIEKQIPYYESILLYGEPGTGKTTIAKSLADENSLDIFYIPCQQLEVGFQTLHSVLNSYLRNKDKPIVVMVEDIDSLSILHARSIDSNIEGVDDNVSGDKPNKFNLTLSDFLNFLCGIDSPENVIFIFTTNNRNILDPAFLRKGRVNHEFYISYLGLDIVQEFIKINYGVDIGIDELKGLRDVTISDLQHLYITHPHCHNAFMRELLSWRE